MQTVAATSSKSCTTPNGWPVELSAEWIEKKLEETMDSLAVQLRCNLEARQRRSISEAQYRMSRRDLVWRFKDAQRAHRLLAGYDYEPAEFWLARDD